MGQQESSTAALCTAVPLCGFSVVPTFAYADDDEDENYDDPTMIEETTTLEPEPTVEPGEGLSEEGNLVIRDLLYDEHTNKQFIAVQMAGGNAFHIATDYDKPVGEGGEQYETYFPSMIDEADLLAATEAAGVGQTACSCSEKYAAGTVNTDYPVCAVSMTEYAGMKSEPVETKETGEPTSEKDGPEAGGNMGTLLLVLAVAMIGGGAGRYFKIHRPKHERVAEPKEDYGGGLDGHDGGEPYGDEEDDDLP